MFQKFGFNIRQAFFNVRRSLMTIITLALAISMIAGLFYYFDAFERDALRSSTQFDMFADLNLIHSSSNQQINCSEKFDLTDYSVYSSVAESELEIESTFKYQSISSLNTLIYANHTNRPDLLALGLYYIQYFRLNLYSFDENFYESYRFTQFFRLLDGTIPENKDEILLDFMTAAKFDYHVGQTVNISTYYQYTFGEEYFVNITNVKVAGLFVPKTTLPYYRIVNNSVLFENFYEEYSEDDLLSLEFDDLYVTNTNGIAVPVLGYSDFEDDDQPFQVFYHELGAEIGADMGVWTSPRRIYYFSGYGITLNRDFTSFFNLYPPDRTVEIGVNALRRSIPYSVVIIDMISAPLQELFEESNRMRIIAQIINIPILIVALIVGSFASKSATQNKVDEFLLLRSKGVSKSMVRRQIFMESFINGIVASVFGAGLGFATFFGHDLWVRPMIYTQFEALDVTLFAKQSSILLSIGLGVILSVLTSISSMRYVSRLETSELLTAIEQKDMEIEFDEQTVFTSTSQSTKEMRKSRRDIQKEYKTAIEEKRKKVKKWSVLFLILALIPFYYYLFILFADGRLPQYWIIQWIELSKNYFVYGFSTVLFIFSPILLTVGIIRIITLEAPVFLGRISRFLGRIFLKDKSYLMGLQMMKKKQYGTVIMFLAVFTAIFVNLNVMAYTFHAQENVYQNYQIGSDLHVSFGFGTNVSNTGELDDLSQDLKAITLNSQLLVEDAMITYEHRHSSYISLYQHYINFSNYLNFVLDGKKIMPNKDFIQTVMDLIDYNLNNPYLDGIPGAIVNQKYLDSNLLEINDIAYLDYRYYDSRLPRDYAFIYGHSVPFRIVGVVEHFPGVYVRPLSETSILTPSEHIVVDVGDLPYQGVDYMLHAPNIHVLVNINYKAETNKDVVEDYLVARTDDYYSGFSNGEFQFYIDKWVSIQNQDSTQLNPLLVYKIGYLIFIVVLIQVALGLPILLASVRQKEQHFYGILMSRGFGKKGVFRFILGELFVIYFIAIIGGLLLGIGSAFLSILLGTICNPYMQGQQFRIFLNPMDLAVILSSVIGVSLLIFTIGFLTDTRKSISDYLYKF